MAIFSKDGPHYELAHIMPLAWRTRAVMPAAYAEAARELTKVALEGRLADTLVFPIIYLYRHAIELHLKSAIREGFFLYRDAAGADLAKPSRQEQHDLCALWRIARALVEALDQDNAEAEFLDRMEVVIDELGQMDDKSTLFRYADAKVEEKIGGTLNLAELARGLEELLDNLESMLSWLDYLNDVRDEIRRECAAEL
jgi:hypothetical protein